MEKKIMANVKWNEFEIDFVKRNAGKLTDKEGARQLSNLVGRVITEYAFRKVRQNLGIKKLPGRGVSKLAKPASTLGEVVQRVSEEVGVSLEEARSRMDF